MLELDLSTIIWEILNFLVLTVILYFLVALGELLDQGRGAVEVGNNLVLITVKTFLNVIQLTLRAVRRGIRQQASNQESNGDTGNQGKSRQQPN